jgi:hypothetical protein
MHILRVAKTNYPPTQKKWPPYLKKNFLCSIFTLFIACEHINKVLMAKLMRGGK